VVFYNAGMAMLERLMDSNFDFGATVENVNAPASPATERNAKALDQWVANRLAKKRRLDSSPGHQTDKA
jgi:hypothetical protein